MTDLKAYVAIAVTVIAVFFVSSLPFLWVYATASACGWRGFFVECRITPECRP